MPTLAPTKDKHNAPRQDEDQPTSWNLLDIMQAYRRVRTAELNVGELKEELQDARRRLIDAKKNLDEMMQQLAAELASQQ